MVAQRRVGPPLSRPFATLTIPSTHQLQMGASYIASTPQQHQQHQHQHQQPRGLTGAGGSSASVAQAAEDEVRRRSSLLEQPLPDEPTPTAGPILLLRVSRPSMDVRLGMTITGGVDTRLRGIFVRAVNPQQAAAAAGVQEGDRILAIGDRGMLHAAYQDALAVLKTAEPNVTLLVQRLGADAWLELVSEAKREARARGGMKLEPSEQAPRQLGAGLEAVPAQQLHTDGSLRCIELAPRASAVVVGGRSSTLGALIVAHTSDGGEGDGDRSLRPGDRLLELGGCSVVRSKMWELEQLAQGLQPPVRLTVQRLGETQWQQLRMLTDFDMDLDGAYNVVLSGAGPASAAAATAPSRTESFLAATPSRTESFLAAASSTPLTATPSPARAPSQPWEQQPQAAFAQEQDVARPAGSNSVTFAQRASHIVPLSGGERLVTLRRVQGRFGFTIIASSDAPRAETEASGTFIHTIESNAAITAGLRIGDRLLEIDGQPVEAMFADAVVERLRASPGPVRIRVASDEGAWIRMSAEHDHSLQPREVTVAGVLALGLGLTFYASPAGSGQEVFIRNIDPMGAAANDGRLRVGDQILSVDGVPASRDNMGKVVAEPEDGKEGRTRESQKKKKKKKKKKKEKG